MKSRLLAVVAASLCLSSCGTYATGEKVGTITKLAQSGVFCKTWEGQIIRGGLSGGSGVMGAPFDFTVEDQRLLPVIQKALDEQQEIRLHYRTEYWTFCRSDSSDHFVTAVEVVTKRSEQPAQPAQTGNLNGLDKTALLRIVAEQNAKILALVGKN